MSRRQKKKDEDDLARELVWVVDLTLYHGGIELPINFVGHLFENSEQEARRKIRRWAEMKLETRRGEGYLNYHTSPRRLHRNCLKPSEIPGIQADLDRKDCAAVRDLELATHRTIAETQFGSREDQEGRETLIREKDVRFLRSLGVKLPDDE